MLHLPSCSEPLGDPTIDEVAVFEGKITFRIVGAKEQIPSYKGVHYKGLHTENSKGEHTIYVVAERRVQGVKPNWEILGHEMHEIIEDLNPNIAEADSVY